MSARAYLDYETRAAVLPSHRLDYTQTRWRVAGGYVSEFGGVTGAWHRTARRADRAAFEAWLADQPLPAAVPLGEKPR